MRNPSKTLLLFLPFVALFLSHCNRWPTDITSEEEMTDRILEEMERQNIPAMAALVFRDDQILYESYQGQADLEQGINLDSNAVFLLASVSKTITGTALLQLAEEGLVDLDAPLNNYLPFAVQVPESTTDITPRMLLTHTSGIADGPAMDSQYYYGEDSPVELRDFMEDYLVPGRQYYDDRRNFHNFEPGENHQYSNIGSALIGVVVEEVSGMDFNAYCQQNIFQPLGMEKTFWRLDEVDQPLVMPYKHSRGSYEAIGHYTFTDYPNGGLRSTPRDLFRFYQAFVNNGLSQGAQILEANTVQQALQAQVPDLDETMGLHFFLMDQSLGLWGHSGGEQGVATVVAFHPTTKIGVILLTNQGSAKLGRLLEGAYALGENL